MIAIARSIVVAAAVALLAMTGPHAQGAKPHRIAIQVDQNDPAVMNLALNNAENIMEYYRDKGEDVDVEVVAYGPGLHMLRADTSPVKDRVAQIASSRRKLSGQDRILRLQQHSEGDGKARGSCDHDHPAGQDRAVGRGAAHRAPGAGLELHPAVI